MVTLMGESTCVREHDRIAGLARAAHDGWAVTVAHAAMAARMQRVGGGRAVVIDAGLDYALDGFLAAQRRLALAEDMRALAIYGVFARSVTVAHVYERFPVAS